jgi:hypothetical protein
LKHESRFSFARLGRKAGKGATALRTWQLALLLIPLVFVSATLLRMNNLGMVERRQAVLNADQAGDVDALKRSLTDLQQFVSHHMNTDMGNGLYLQYSYDKAYDAALSAAADSTNPNSAVYQQASVECRSRYQGYQASFRADYVQCVIDRVSSLAPEAEKTAALPSADNYRFAYASPLWSPDFAGLFVALSAIVVVLIIIRSLAYWLFRLIVRLRLR